MTTSVTTAGTTMRVIIQERYGEAENVLRLGQAGLAPAHDLDGPGGMSTAIIRRVPGPGAVRCWAQVPAASSRASASRSCKVRRNVDSHGTTPGTPSASKVA